MRRMTLAVAALAASAANALAQNAPPPAEVGGEPISSLMFFTLGAILLLAIGSFVWFLRKKSNRAAADRALDPNHPANR
jgi:LPXTG-motif cell wall-anchored protein